MNSHLRCIKLNFIYTICALFSLISIIKAELMLVDSHDYIEFNKTSGEEIFKAEISGFKNYQSFSQDHSIYGYACYFNLSSKFDEYYLNNSCILKSASPGQWVLITPYDDSNFVDNLNLLNTKYRIQRYLVSPKTTNTFSNSCEGLDNGDFLFIFYFTTFIQKEQLESCLIITASYLNRKKRSSSQMRFCQIHRERTGQRRIRYKDNFQGVIFTYDGSVQISHAAPNNPIPSVISFAKADTISYYNVSTMSYPYSDQYKITLSHFYLEYCDIMVPAYKFYIISLSLWGLCIIFHVLWTWCIKKEHSTHLQKILLFIPVFFLGYSLLDFIYYNACPWLENSGIQYLQIVQIALVTIFNTLFVGLCCFVSKGWSVMRSSFTREELSSITMTVGIFYLVYSAYFIASDIPSLKLVIIIVLIIMYLWVTVTCARNCILNIKVLRSHIRITGPEEILMDSLKLKQFMMYNLLVITLIFYSNKIVYSALFTFIDNNYFCRNLIIVNLFVELSLICYMMFVFRSRKWPEYFSLDVFYQDIGNNDNDRDRLPKSIILTASLPSKWALNHSKTDILLNGKEIKEIKSRNFKDPELALVLESSEIDSIAIKKQSETDTKCSLYSEIKLAVEEDDSSDTE